MNWDVGLLTTATWMLTASFWHYIRPLPDDITHRAFSIRAGQDLLPALLLGLLMARLF
jgi:hypothetical protein